VKTRNINYALRLNWQGVWWVRTAALLVHSLGFLIAKRFLNYSFVLLLYPHLQPVVVRLCLLLIGTVYSICIKASSKHRKFEGSGGTVLRCWMVGKKAVLWLRHVQLVDGVPAEFRELVLEDAIVCPVSNDILYSILRLWDYSKTTSKLIIQFWLFALDMLPPKSPWSVE